MGSSPRCATCVWYRPPPPGQGRGRCVSWNRRVEPGFGCAAHARAPDPAAQAVRLRQLASLRESTLAEVEGLLAEVAESEREIRAIFSHLRVSHGLSREVVAEAAGCSQTPIRSLERGSVPDPARLDALVRALTGLAAERYRTRKRAEGDSDEKPPTP